MRSWNLAFDKVLREFGISAKWLSCESGVSEYMISQFRKGHKDATTGTLSKLLICLPQDAQFKFFSLILGATLQLPPIEEQIENLSKESKKKLVMSLVEQIAV